MTHTQNHNFTSPLRYPGGKGALANFIKLIISNNNLLDGNYVELYAGGASIAWSLLFEEYIQRVHVNDINPSVMSFWNSVLYDTENLCRLIRNTEINMEQWHQQRQIQNNPEEYSRLELGFSTFFLNRTNRSGILKGGVIGGKSQDGEWKLDARFNKQDLVKRIERIARYSNRIQLYNLDAMSFIRNNLPSLPQRTLVYLDPPYFNKGQDLYENHYNQNDHAHIAQVVTNDIQQPWVVSYDAAEKILELYTEYPSIKYNISYSAQQRYQGSEVIFFSTRLAIPNISNPSKIKTPLLQPTLL
jgi:DNA adenine methylase